MHSIFSSLLMAGTYTVDREKVLFAMAEMVERDLARELAALATKEGTLKCQPYLF